MTLLSRIQNLFAPAVAALAPDAAGVPAYLAMIKPAANADHGDYQANFAMAMAKALGRKPPEVAAAIIAGLPANDLIETPTVAGPGFINVRLKTRFLANAITALPGDPRLGVAVPGKPQTFVIDLSGPNVAKPLHVGHLRSTIIGDSLVRILRFSGHTVVGDNHLGDWGTQFGILLYGYKHHLDAAAYAADPVRELARLYIHVRDLAKVVGDEDDATGDVMEACRRETAKLHAGDAENNALWTQFMPACLDMLKPIYDRLDVKIDHALGESFYNPMLSGVVADLLAKGAAVESQGAVVVPNAKGVIPAPEDSRKEDPPALVRKRDGAFTYTATDLATIQYRAETWKPDVMLYVVDARQVLHFKTLFANARRWGYVNVRFEHVQFGSILGPDKKPLRTRDGGVPELMPLLDEAVKLGLAKYEASRADRIAHGHVVPDLTDDVKADIAEAIGIGAVKYADLGQNRTSDYVFDYEKMLSPEGNTATYMQYAYARCRGVLRDAGTFAPAPVTLDTPYERTLALHLLKFPEAVEAAAAESYPHYLSAYLWDTGRAFSGFYEKCKVLKAETPELRASRLVLVELVARTIQLSLGLLGVRVVDRM